MVRISWLEWRKNGLLDVLSKYAPELLKGCDLPPIANYLYSHIKLTTVLLSPQIGWCETIGLSPNCFPFVVSIFLKIVLYFVIPTLFLLLICTKNINSNISSVIFLFLKFCRTPFRFYKNRNTISQVLKVWFVLPEYSTLNNWTYTYYNKLHEVGNH